MDSMPIYGKNLKIKSSPEPFGPLLETWYIASGTSSTKYKQ